MEQAPETLAGIELLGGLAQQELGKDGATPAVERRVGEPLQNPNSSKIHNGVADAPVAAAAGRGLLLGLQAPIKLYPPNASSSNAASGGNSFAHYCTPANYVQPKTSLNWCTALPHRQAVSLSSVHTSKHLSDNSSAPAMHAQAQQLALPQQAAAVATWQPSQSNAAAGPAVCCTPNISSVAGSSITSSKHSRPLQLHKQQERERNMGVLLMERRLAQLSQALEEAQALQEQYAQQLTDANAAHKQRFGNMQAAGQARLQALQLRMTQHLEQRGQRQLLVRCTAAWRQRVCMQRCAQQMLQQVHRKQMQACCWGWVLLTKQSRAQAHEDAAPQQAARQQQRQHLEQVLAAWQSQAVQQQQRRIEQLGRAVRWQHRRVQHAALGTWHCMCIAKMVQRQRAHTLWHRRLLSRAFKAWAAASAVLSKQSSSSYVAAHLQQQAFHAWRGWMFLQAQQQRLQQLRQQHVLRRAWQLWVQHRPSLQEQHAAASAAFAGLGTRLLKQWGLQAFVEQLQEHRACQQLQQQKVLLLVGKWRQLAAAASRRERLVAARQAAAMQRQLQQCLGRWWHHTAAAGRQAATKRATALQDSLIAQQSALDCAQAQQGAAAEQLKLTALHNQQLQQQAIDACRGALAGMQFLPALAWRSLPFHPGQAGLQPRARHAAFRLDALQPPQHRQQQLDTVTTDSSSMNSLCCSGIVSSECLLVYGGVHGSSWLDDLTLLVLEQEAAGGMKTSSIAVPVRHGAANGTAGSCSNGDAASQLVLPVRDFAACACGQNQFVVSGGFGSDLGAFHLQLYELKRDQTAPVQLDNTSCTPIPNSSSNSSSSWYSGWSASCSLLQSRSQAPRPPGRCHHSICCYPGGASLVVFGGWADKQGCLNDVWLFHMQHMEWWQPEVAGTWPCHRRSHAAALVGQLLFVHGGLGADGTHLADMWCLDLQAWQWTQCCAPQVAEGAFCPSARRAHTLEVVADRYLLLHGGYDGSSLVGDTWMFDTRSSRWLAVHVQAPASEMPAPRALHTLTSLGQRFVLLGGKGPLGELGDVSLLECPAVQQGLLLQHQQQASQAQLLCCQQGGAQVAADLACSRAELQGAKRQLQAALERNSQLTAQATASSRRCYARDCQLQEARAAAAAAQLESQQAAKQVQALERRLERARQGGNKALEAATSLSQQLQAAEAGRNVLCQQLDQAQQQLDQAQQQLQQQQLVLSERAAEVAVMRSELAESQTRGKTVAAASSNAQSDFKVALARSNKLYSQELRHLQGLLQAARKSQKQLAQQVAQLQAQPPQAPQPPAAPDSTAPAAAQDSLLDQQQQQQQQQPADVVHGMSSQPACAAEGPQPSRRCSNCRSSKRASSSDDISSAVDAAWQAAGSLADFGCISAGCQGSGQLLCMSAGQLALMSSRQGSAQAQLELVQQQLQKQQEEMAALKQQLSKERHAAATAQELRAAAVEQLHLAEQRHQQQLQQLEENVKGFKWKLWEVEADAARRGNRGYHTQQQQSKDAWKLGAVWPANIEQDVRATSEMDGTLVGPAVDAVANTGGAAVDGWAGSAGQFSVELVPRPGPADQLEMLSEVVRLFELHRSTMSSSIL